MAKLLLQPGTAQLKGFFPSWSPSTWLSKLKRRVNFFSQPSLGHGNILLSPEWTRSSCRRKNQKLLNSLLHRPHSTLSETRGVVSVLQLAWVTWHQCFLEFHLYLCVLFCASDNLTKFFPEKDTLQSHKGSLPQKDRFYLSTRFKRNSLLWYQLTFMYFLMMLQFFKSEKFSRASSQGTTWKEIRG